MRAWAKKCARNQLLTESRCYYCKQQVRSAVTTASPGRQLVTGRHLADKEVRRAALLRATTRSPTSVRACEMRQITMTEMRIERPAECRLRFPLLYASSAAWHRRIAAPPRSPQASHRGTASSADLAALTVLRKPPETSPCACRHSVMPVN